MPREGPRPCARTSRRLGSLGCCDAHRSNTNRPATGGFRCLTGWVCDRFIAKMGTVVNIEFGVDLARCVAASLRHTAAVLTRAALR